MRQDMEKLVSFRSIDVSGPRRLTTRGFTRDLQTLPHRQSVRASVPHWRGTAKEVGPLVRWLNRQVGRTWNAVYAELRGRFDPRSDRIVVMRDVLQAVSRNTFVGDDGAIKCRQWGDVFPVSGLYVDPVTGLLQRASCVGRVRRRREHRQQAARAVAARRIIVGPTLQLHKIDGCWFWVDFARITAPVEVVVPAVIVNGMTLFPPSTRVDPSTVCRDVITGREFYSLPTTYQRQDLEQQYGAGMGAHYPCRKWQASSRDIARYVRA